MNKTRMKIKTTTPKTREDIEALVGDLAAAKIEQQGLTAEMDAEIAMVRTRFEAGLALLTERLNVMTEVAHLWAQAHPEEFAKRKSLEFTQGVIGFRTTPHKLKLLSKWTWAKVLEKMEPMNFWRAYIRTKKEVDKEALIANRDGLPPENLAGIGVKIVQDEEFFIEPKLTAVETRQTAAA